jgi:hypothetical protein
VALVCTLHQPDARFLPLAFMADTLRDLGAYSIGLDAHRERRDMKTLAAA